MNVYYFFFFRLPKDPPATLNQEQVSTLGQTCAQRPTTNGQRCKDAQNFGSFGLARDWWVGSGDWDGLSSVAFIK